jgi:type I restriction enzyme S subunit
MLDTHDLLDEPAQVLLERAAEHRARSSPQHRAGAAKPVEEPFALPGGWCWTRIGDVGIVAPRNDAPDDLITGFVPMPLVPQDHRAAVRHEPRPWGQIRRAYTHLANGDLAVAKITPCFQNAKSCVVAGLPAGIGAGTTELHVLRPYEGVVDPAYLLVFVKSPMFLAAGEMLMTGTAGQQRVPLDYFAFRPVPLPPLDEQRRIVAKVNELMALCDALEAACVQVSADAECAVTSVASFAVRSDARGERAWSLLSAAIDACRDVPAGFLAIQDLVLRFALGGHIAGATSAESHGLPAGWRMVKLQDVVSATDSGWSPSCPPEPTSGDEQWGVLRTTAVQRLSFQPEHHKRLPDTLAPRPELEVRAGDLLVTRAGPTQRVGVWCFVRETRPKLMLSDKIVRCRLRTDLAHGEYLAMCLNSGVSADYLRSLQSGMDLAQMNVSQPKIRSIPVPLPPLEEQRAVVRAVQSLWKQIAILKHREDDLADVVGSLASSIITRALDA